jgi:hypothetical protein
MTEVEPLFREMINARAVLRADVLALAENEVEETTLRRILAVARDLSRQADALAMMMIKRGANDAAVALADELLGDFIAAEELIEARLAGR